MESLKEISDELWLGLICLLAAVWLFALKPAYLIISVAFTLVGVFLIIIDGVKKSEKKNAVEDVKVEKASVKKTSAKKTSTKKTTTKKATGTKKTGVKKASDKKVVKE